MYKPWIVALVLAAAGCGGGGAAATPSETEPGGSGAPASLALSHTTASVAAGSTVQLSATPVNAGGAAMSGLPAPSWSTSDAGVAAVSGGMVSGVGVGTATITASLTAGGTTRTASAQVTVTPRAAAFASLALAPATGTVAVGATLPLTATPLDANGQPVAGLPGPTFSTSDAGRAAVGATGVVSGVAAGAATITASLTAGGVTRTATAAITVTAPAQSGSSATVRGLEHAFSPAAVTIAPGGTVTWTMVDDEHDVTWTGTAPPQGNIPRTDRGVSVTRAFPAAGSYGYRCARHENHNETGTVLVQGGSQGAVFTGVAVAPAAPSVAVGGTAQLAATALDQNGQPMAGLPAASWSTGDPARVAVGASGVVTGVASGTTTVTASITSGGVTRTGSATVTVTAAGAPAPGPSSAVVTTPGSSFAPQTATIAVGGTVTWEISGATHNVTFAGAAPQGGNVPDSRAGTSVSRQFTAAGTFDYQCTRHSGMQGRVVVQ